MYLDDTAIPIIDLILLMARKKVKLARIENDSARRATFKKRKKGLMKKVSELSTLCGVNACAIVCSPYDPQPEVWPPSPSEAHRVLTRFKSLPEMEQNKKMLNQEGFLKQRISKLKEHLMKQQNENTKHTINDLMFQVLTGKIDLHDVDYFYLNKLNELVQEKIKGIDERVNFLIKNKNQQPQQLNTSTIGITQGQESILLNNEISGNHPQYYHYDQDYNNNNSNTMGFDGEAMKRQPWLTHTSSLYDDHVITPQYHPHEMGGYGGVEDENNNNNNNNNEHMQMMMTAMPCFYGDNITTTSSCWSSTAAFFA